MPPKCSIVPSGRALPIPWRPLTSRNALPNRLGGQVGPPGHRVSTPWSFSGRVGNRSEVTGERLGELLNQLGIRVNSSGGLPLSDRLGQRCPLPDLGRSLERPNEVGDELNTVVLGKDVCPGELIEQRCGDSLGLHVFPQGAQCTGSRHGTLGCGASSIVPGEQQRGTIAPPHPNVAAVGQRGHTLRVALEFAPLHLNCHATILNFFRIRRKPLLCHTAWSLVSCPRPDRLSPLG